MNRILEIIVYLSIILAIVCWSVHAIFIALWQVPVIIRIDPLDSRSVDLQISCYPSELEVRNSTLITGKLINATNRESIPWQEIKLYYKPTDGLLWTFIDETVTINDGSFSYLWTEASTLSCKYYVINGTFLGNQDFDGWSSITYLHVYFGEDDATSPLITDVVQKPSNNSVTDEDIVEVNATIFDDLSGVYRVTLAYTTGNGTWFNKVMMNIEGDIWNSEIPCFPYCTNMTYMIVAEDIVGNTRSTTELGYTLEYHVIPEFQPFIFVLLGIMTSLLGISIYHMKNQ